VKSALWDFTLFTERRWWQAVTLVFWAILIVASFTGCFLNHIGGPEIKTVRGTITTVRRNEDYESTCGPISRLIGCQPSPQAYDAVVTDSLGHKTWFMFFVDPFGTGGVPGEGWTGVFTLRRHQQYELAKCRGYQAGQNLCPYSVGYNLDDLHDVAP